MAIKLYPPLIEGSIPAFYTHYTNGSRLNGTTKLVVPFSMNKTVANRDVKGMALKIKTVQSNALIIQDQVGLDNITFDPSYTVTFNLNEYVTKKLLKVGQYYKVQIAYINQDEQICYFSTVGVVKYTEEPEVTLDGLEYGQGQINMHQYQYVGRYYQLYDTTEKAYSYTFNLYNLNGELLQTSGEQIHNASNDIDAHEQHDIYEIEQDLEMNKSYYLEYIITTTNGLKKSSGKYRIMQKKSIDPEIKADLVPTLNFENGYVDVKLDGQKNADGVEYAATGSFKILRASDEDHYATWHEVLRFALYGQQPSRWVWKDLTVKQGVTYKYALQQYNDKGLTSNRLESEPLYVDFEHAFLYDGNRQLKIKYNPKMSSFKNNVLENKTDTIGNKFPFIFRNGNVKYKEFPISGLISCLVDEENLFIHDENFGDHDSSANLISQNIATEREFKLEVLEWLNNGKPKLFRSPTEGNYIVRLMNVSLAPNDTLGRMLHTFSATAYEIADYTYKNLSDLNLIAVGDPTTQQLRWETIELDKTGKGDPTANILNYKAVALRFEGMIPGDIIHINDGIERISGEDEYGNPIRTLGFDVVIGVTGSYLIELNSGVIAYAVNFKKGIDTLEDYHGVVQHQGTLTYAYYSRVQNRFDSVTDFAITDVPLLQFIGEHNIFDEIEDVKVEIQSFYRLRCILREIQPVYYNIDNDGNGHYYRSQSCIPGDYMVFDDYVIYSVQDLANSREFYLDGHSQKVIDSYSSYIEINGIKIDLAEIYSYDLEKPENIKSFSIGSGVMAEISFQKQIVDYAVEFDKQNYPTLVEYKENAEKKEADLNALIWNAQPDSSTEDLEYLINTTRAEHEIAYNIFIEELKRVLEEKEATQGDVAS